MSEARIEQAPVQVPAHDSHGHSSAARGENLKFGMWLFIASEVIIFTVLIATYILFRINHPEVVKDVHEVSGILLVSVNTFLLLASSWTMVMGLMAIRRGDQGGLARWIGFTAILGTIFVALQMVEYSLLSSEGILLNTEFGMRFYSPTALHGVHVVIGVLWALYVIRNARRGAYSASSNIGVEIFGLYWHFVDVVWIFLFTIIYLV